MSRKKRKAKINPVFSNDILKDHFSMMYVSQLRSKAYIELSVSATMIRIYALSFLHLIRGYTDTKTGET